MSLHRASLSRRQFLTVLGGMTGMAALAACAAPAAAPATGGEAAAPAAEGRELVFWGHDQHPIDLAAEGFVEKYPEITWVSPHPADRGEKVVATMAAGTGAPDLYWAEATDAQDWGCNELLTDLSDHLKPEIDQYHPAKVAETFIAKTGKHVGWPGDISVSGWYYRQDKLEEAGMGDVDLAAMTWPDFIGMAGELAQQGMNTFCFPADGWSALFMFALHQVGGTAVSQDGQNLTVGDEKGVAAMQIVKNLWDAGRTENPDQPAGLDVAWWSPPYWAALKEGTLIGDFAAAWAKGFWEANLQDAEDTSAFGNWRIAKFPGGDGIQYRTGIWGGAQLVNPKAGANTEDAILFMQYALGSVEGAARCGEWGIIPAYRPYLESDEFLSQRSPVFGDWEFCQFWAEQEKELSPEYFRPAGWGAVNTIVGREMVPILLDEYGVEDGMARIVELATPDFERTRCV
jgi:ABC-type glycerol-3-phosphate transport system substrate-binding protein